MPAVWYKASRDIENTQMLLLGKKLGKHEVMAYHDDWKRSSSSSISLSIRLSKPYLELHLRETCQIEAIRNTSMFLTRFSLFETHKLTGVFARPCKLKGVQSVMVFKGGLLIGLKHRWQTRLLHPGSPLWRKCPLEPASACLTMPAMWHNMELEGPDGSRAIL